MGEIEVLLVEDNASWRDQLVDDIRRACAERVLCIVDTTGKRTKDYPPRRPSPEREPQAVRVWLAESYEQAKRLFGDPRQWRLVITDVGLAEGDKSGKRVAQQAQESGAPCLVVSRSLVSGIDDVSELYRDYHIYDFFNKEYFDRKRFVGHIRNILDPPTPIALPASGPVYHPSTTVIPPREVVIGAGGDCIILRSEGFQPFTMQDEFTKLFIRFVIRVAQGAPGRRVDNGELNEAVGRKPSFKTSVALRKTISTLNKKLNDKFGPTPKAARSGASTSEPGEEHKIPNDERWIPNLGRKGYALNTDQLRWTPDLKQLEPLLTLFGEMPHSIRTVLLDSISMARNTPEGPLPARPKRKRPLHGDEDDLS